MYPQVKVQSFIPQEAKSKNEMGLASFFSFKYRCFNWFGIKWLLQISLLHLNQKYTVPGSNLQLVSGFPPGLAVYRYTE